MTKNIIKATLFSGVLLASSVSCERELDQISFSAQTEADAYKDPTNFTQTIFAAYSAMRGTGYFSTDTGNQLIIPDLTTDNLILNPEGRTSNFSAYNWSITPNDGGTTGLYIRAYNAIAQANLALKNLGNLPDGPFKTNIEAQGRGIRGMIHFDLVRAYSKIPTQSADANASLGIAYVETFDPLNLGNVRSLSVAQTYQKILGDLLFAVDNITDNPADKSTLSKAAINGLLSRIYLYMGDYGNSVKYGNLAIAASPSVGSAANFTSIWQSNSTDGVLFKLLNNSVPTATESITTGVAYQQGATATAGNIRSEYVVPKSLFDAFASNDIRKTPYIRTSSYVAGSSTTVRNHVIKYAFRTSPAGFPLNVAEIKYLRTAEVYLNVAEAAYKSSTPDFALANQLLNTLKAQRYTGYVPVTLSGTALLTEILTQRRLELAFETDRLWTLKRLGLPMQRTGEGPNVDGSGVASLTQIIQPSDFRWQWPIPKTAIDKNAAIVQNPGY